MWPLLDCPSTLRVHVAVPPPAGAQRQSSEVSSCLWPSRDRVWWPDRGGDGGGWRDPARSCAPCLLTYHLPRSLGLPEPGRVSAALPATVPLLLLSRLRSPCALLSRLRSPRASPQPPPVPTRFSGRFCPYMPSIATDIAAFSRPPSPAGTVDAYEGPCSNVRRCRFRCSSRPRRRRRS